MLNIAQSIIDHPESYLQDDQKERKTFFQSGFTKDRLEVEARASRIVFKHLKPLLIKNRRSA